MKYVAFVRPLYYTGAAMYNNKTILVTGGTGSLGRSYARFLLENHAPKKVIVFSRDELKQFQMDKEFAKYGNVRFFLGDVRDLARLERAFQGVDIVVHAAALKQVPALEYNPFEAVQTNIVGSQNVITAALDQGVERVLLVSTDKAAHPVNLYGATKMCAERLFVSSNVYAKSGPKATKFSVVRYGNVLGSRGSVVENILTREKKEPLKLTDPEMTRFWITLDQCFALITYALTSMVGGEVFVPKIPSMKVSDLFEALAPGCEIIVTGIRPGEKIHETLVTTEEMRTTVDMGKYFIILPPSLMDASRYAKYKKSKRMKGQERMYTSNTNTEWLDTRTLHKLSFHK